jgi:hypothetical protein
VTVIIPLARKFAFSAVLLGASLLVGSAAMPPVTSRAQAMALLQRELRSDIATMSTGPDQKLAVTGETAAERNDLIPLSQLRLESPGYLARNEMSASSRSTAEKCLAQAIYYEAALEPLSGQRAVAQVVLNRVRHPAYPDTVCGVVYQGVAQPVCQFSFTCDGSLLRVPSRSNWDHALLVARQMLDGGSEPEVGTATHYHADYVVPRWAYTLGKITQIGHHIFYRFPGGAGSAAAFDQRWSGLERIPSLDWDRLRARMAASQVAASEPSVSFVPGTTVTPDVKDRHADADVGGRLDTTRGWTLSIPDPTKLSTQYRAAQGSQGQAAPISDAASASDHGGIQ